MSTPPPPVSSAKPQLPASVTHFGLNSIALAVILGVLLAMRSKVICRVPFICTPAGEIKDPVFYLWCAVAIPIVALDLFVLRVHRRSSTGLDWDKPAAFDMPRVLTKLLGFVVTLAPFALAYWTFSEYLGSFYDPYYNMLKRSGLALALASVIYFAVVDAQMIEPKDAYWQLGRVFLFRPSDANRAEIANHYRGWLVKAYFFPLMFVWLNNSTHNVIHFDLANASWDNLRLYDFLYDFIFFIDLLMATVGYAVCFRPLDTHLRSAEPTFLGWGVALFCYEPFFSGLFEKHYVHYGGNSFSSWLSPYVTFRWIWAGVIIVLISIYVLATVAFGVRFSNLTHRGILTNGPYRFTKHPAYVSKNISWWMASVPFVMSDNLAATVRRCLCLGVLNFMYFMRAKTEERHLSRDPTYVAYALWMNENGVLRFLNRIPLVKYAVLYKPPTTTPAPKTAVEPEGAALPADS